MNTLKKIFKERQVSNLLEQETMISFFPARMTPTEFRPPTQLTPR